MTPEMSRQGGGGGWLLQRIVISGRTGYFWQKKLTCRNPFFNQKGIARVSPDGCCNLSVLSAYFAGETMVHLLAWKLEVVLYVYSSVLSHACKYIHTYFGTCTSRIRRTAFVCFFVGIYSYGCSCSGTRHEEEKAHLSAKQKNKHRETQQQGLHQNSSSCSSLVIDPRRFVCRCGAAAPFFFCGCLQLLLFSQDLLASCNDSLAILLEPGTFHVVS